MDQIIIFDKSLQQRLEEYNNLFSGSHLTFSTLQKEWAYYLEFTLDPSGWQAVWKIPRLKCESFKIRFPTIVLVYVLKVDYEELTAVVRVLAVQDDISIPEKHNVPLVQLWPTRDQDKSIGLNLNCTANVLDMLRFFYIHLFMPWDEENSSDWRIKHLESRLRFFYDLKNGIIPKVTAEHIYRLLNEAKRLSNKQQLLQSELNDDVIDSQNLEVEKVNNDKLEALTELNVRLMQIQGEIDILENPLLRSVIIKKQQAVIPEKSQKCKVTWIVCEAGKADDHINFLQKVKNYYPHEELMFAYDLMSKLAEANHYDTFILNECNHFVRNDGALIENWTIKGLGSCKETFLVSQVDDVMLDMIGENVSLENITIDARSSQCAILIRRGKAVLNKCKIIGDATSTTHQGIIVLCEARLEMRDCEITGFATAIVGNSGSGINLSNSEIHDVYVGLKIYDDCSVDAENVIIRDCKEYGVEVETEIDCDVGKEIGGFKKLDVLPGIFIRSMSGSSNTKGDVIIRRPSIKALEDLFANPDSDPTILESSTDDEMDVGGNLNSTVLESYSYNGVE